MAMHTLPEASQPERSVLNRIPPFPAALVFILRSCAAENPSAAEVARAVSMEEILAARVVRAANASNLAPIQPVENVVAAVSRLGTTAVRGIATAYFLTKSFAPAFANSGLDRERLWRHNLAVASASAGASGGANRADAYFAGLVHDVGKMVLAVEFGSAYGRCLAEAARSGVDLVQVETEVLGMDHAEVGASAAEQWNFAPEVVEAIRRHHQLLGAGLLPALASHVLVGNQVAQDMGLGLGEAPGGSSAVAVASISAGIGAGIMSRARWTLTNELPRIDAILGVL
jgi:putative nucleotidyltransferase with HDIG domain